MSARSTAAQVEPWDTRTSTEVVDALVAVAETGRSLEDEDILVEKARSFSKARLAIAADGFVLMLSNGQVFHVVVKEVSQ